MHKLCFVTLASLLTVTANAPAHTGPRIWIGQEGGRIVTYSSTNDLSPSTATFNPSRLFFGGPSDHDGRPTGQFDTLAPTVHTTDFPGFQERPGAGLNPQSVFSFAVTAPLKVYDPTAGIEDFRVAEIVFGDPGPAPQVLISLDAAVTGAGPVNGFEFFRPEEPGAHSHLRYTLSTNGQTATDAPDGVYLLELELRSSSYQTSETFVLLLSKGVAYGSEEYDAAILAATGIVPEPASAMLIGLGLLAPLAGRRRRRVA